MKKIFYTAFYFCSALLLSSCIGDLDQYPQEDETAASIYTSAATYKDVLGKNLYGNGNYRTRKKR